MLAKEFEPDGKAASRPGFFPRTVQPKLDGVRMLANVDEGTGRFALTSRTGKPFDHLVSSFEHDLALLPRGLTLDGELYYEGAGFQRVVSLVKNTKMPDADRERLMYNVYDVVLTGVKYADRERFLAELFSKHRFRRFKRVPSQRAHDLREVEAMHDEAVRNGYEGVMLRDDGGLYECGKRSGGLLKYKRFLDAEFVIVGHEEATGKDAGTVVLVCATKDGNIFNVRPMGTLQHRARMLADAKVGRLKGKQLTVKFQELTPDGIPRFPVGIAVRDYE